MSNYHDFVDISSNIFNLVQVAHELENASHCHRYPQEHPRQGEEKFRGYFIYENTFNSFDIFLFLKRIFKFSCERFHDFLIQINNVVQLEEFNRGQENKDINAINLNAEIADLRDQVSFF